MGHSTVTKRCRWHSTAFGSDSTGSRSDFELPHKVLDGFGRLFTEIKDMRHDIRCVFFTAKKNLKSKESLAFEIS